MKTKVWLFLVLSYTLTTFGVSSIKNTSFIPDLRIVRFDLVLHFIEYGILAWLILRYLDTINQLSPWIRQATLVVIFCGVVGGLNELWQLHIPGRFPSVVDGIANVLGAVVVVFLYRLRKCVIHFDQ
ncbi:MAG: VanZ family protein [Candidatus Hatepunaea meridiana]|nr:VanZ family protein [Candidatus Hatepunaea meridiana]